MKQSIEDLFESFLGITEYANVHSVDFRIMFTKDIYNTVLQDDPEYARRKNIETTYGLYYISRTGEQWLIIKENNNYVEVLHNLFHELIHIYDFNKLVLCMNESDIRKLQDNIFFVLWSEFHAEYYSYKYLVQLGKDNINPTQVVSEFQKKLKDFMSKQSRIEVQDVADFCVRQYGQYLALYDCFMEDVSKYPSHFFVNEKFLALYDYLCEHKTFESIKRNIGELENIFKSLEPHGDA